MSASPTDAAATLEAVVLEVLRAHPEGTSEFALFAALAGRGFSEFSREVFADSLRMFRSHFALFHVLYAMRERLAIAREGHLTIESVRVRLVPWAEHAVAGSGAALDAHDPLRDYYLDLENLDAMTERGLTEMLGAFWARFHADGRRDEALAALGLERGADWDAIKSRHRALVFEHHPDRGGDAEKLVAVNAAMRLLERARR